MSSRVEKQIAELREMISEIHTFLFAGKAPAPADEEYKKAIEAMVDGNPAPLARYCRRTGGIVPKADTIYPVERGGRN